METKNDKNVSLKFENGKLKKGVVLNLGQRPKFLYKKMGAQG